MRTKRNKVPWVEKRRRIRWALRRKHAVFKGWQNPENSPKPVPPIPIQIRGRMYLMFKAPPWYSWKVWTSPLLCPRYKAFGSLFRLKTACSYRNLNLRPPLHFLGLDLPCNWFSHFYFNFEPVSSLLKQFSFSLYFSHMCLFLCENIYQWSWTCVLCTSGNILEFYLKFFFINMGY